MRKKTDAERTDIVRRDWERLKVRRSLRAFFTDLLMLLFFLGALFVLLAALLSFLAISSGFGIALLPLVALIFLLTAIITSIVYLLNFLSVKYELQSGSVRKIDDEYTDQITGKIIVQKGILSTHIDVYLASEMDRVEVVQGLLGKILGYGDIKLKETDMLQETSSFRLRFVDNPREMAMLIQDMIDVQGQNGSQVPM